MIKLIEQKHLWEIAQEEKISKIKQAKDKSQSTITKVNLSLTISTIELAIMIFKKTKIIEELNELHIKNPYKSSSLQSYD